MNLKAYIEKHGDQIAARTLAAPVRTVRSWRLGERVPKPSKAADIEKRTGRRVKIAECYA